MSNQSTEMLRRAPTGADDVELEESFESMDYRPTPVGFITKRPKFIPCKIVRDSTLTAIAAEQT